MPATYDPTTDLGKVRFLIPDRDTGSPLFTDAELQACLDMEGNVYRAAAMAVESLTGEKAQQYYDYRTENYGESLGQVPKNLAEHAKALRARGNSILQTGKVTLGMDVYDSLRPESVYYEFQASEHD